MPRGIIHRIRETITNGRYDMTHHSVEEMAEDDLDIFDIEHSIFNGKIIKREKDDPRGTKYIIQGYGIDNVTKIRVVGRFKVEDNFLILTVYKIID
jgi:hypothetical protein